MALLPWLGRHRAQASRAWALLHRQQGHGLTQVDGTGSSEDWWSCSNQQRWMSTADASAAADAQAEPSTSGSIPGIAAVEPPEPLPRRLLVRDFIQQSLYHPVGPARGALG